MFLIFLLFWILLNGHLTLEIFLFGLAIAAAMYALSIKFLDFSFKKDFLLVKSLGILIVWFFILLWEIILANLNVLKFIYSPKYVPEPAIVYFNVDLQSGIAKTLLANSITLTPGTVTVSVDGNEFCVHALDKAFADGIEDCSFVRILKKMEAGWK